MAKTTISWKYDSGVGDGFRIYRSDTPMDPDDLPEPLATVTIDKREYDDETVVQGETYYYRVGSYIGLMESVSAELEHIAEAIGDEHWDKVVSLLHFDGDLTDETGLVWTQHGSAIVSTIDPKFGSGSLSVPGTSGYIQTLSELIAGAEGNRLTVELFVKVRTLTKTGMIFDFRPPNTNGNYLVLSYTPSGTLTYNVHGVDHVVAPAGTVGISNGWTHYALVVDGSTLRMFVGGVMVGSFNGVTNYNASNHVRIGRSAFAASTAYPDAAFDELRITKGVARYTENFTPPTEPFPNFGN